MDLKYDLPGDPAKTPGIVGIVVVLPQPVCMDHTPSPQAHDEYEMSLQTHGPQWLRVLPKGSEASVKGLFFFLCCAALLSLQQGPPDHSDVA